MRLKTLCLSAISLFPACAGDLDSKETPAQVEGSTTQEIFGGSDIDTLEVKAVVSINGGSCTGTFIHPHYIMTAAHCLPQCMPGGTGCFNGSAQDAVDGEATGIDGPLAMVADDKLVPDGNNAYNIDFVWFPQPHDFDEETPPDVAFLHTREFFSGKVIPVMPWGQLPTSGSVCDNWDDFGVDQIGYSNNEGASDTRRRLGRFDVTCDVELDDRAFLMEETGSKACPGDSGGPVLWRDGNGRYTVGAVHSFTRRDDDESCMDEDSIAGNAFIPRHLLERIAAAETTCGGLAWDACVTALDNPAGSSSAGAHYPLNHQLEIARVRPDGSVGLYWKAQNGEWQPPVTLAGPGFSAGEGGTSTVYYPPNEQFETFVVDQAGAVNVIWKAGNGVWMGPVGISTPGLAPPGAAVAAVYYPVNQQLEVFVVGNDGRVWVLWKAQNGVFNQAPISPPGWWAKPGSNLTATYYPLQNQLEVFTVGGDNKIYTLWKVNNSAWAAVPISAAQYPWDAGITSTYYPLNEQLEVFAVDLQGRVNVLWKAQNGNWSEAAFTEPGFARAGTPITSAYYPLQNQLEVVLAGSNGAPFVLWKVNNGPLDGRHQLIGPGNIEASGRLDAVFNPLNNQLEVFVEATDGTLGLLWKEQNGAWNWGDVGPFEAPPPAGTVTLYEHANFKGISQSLAPGRYNDLAGQLSIGNDIVSSVRIPLGMTVILYEHSNFTGATKTLFGDNEALFDFNDTTSSVEILNLGIIPFDPDLPIGDGGGGDDGDPVPFDPDLPIFGG